MDAENVIEWCQGCGENLIYERDLGQDGLPLYGCQVCHDQICRDCDARYGICSSYECQKTADIP